MGRMDDCTNATLTPSVPTKSVVDGRWWPIAGVHPITDECPRLRSVFITTKFPTHKSIVGAVPLTDGRQSFASPCLSPSSLLPSRILSIYRPVPKTSTNSALKLTLTHYNGHEGSLVESPITNLTDCLISGLSGMPHKAHTGRINHCHSHQTASLGRLNHFHLVVKMPQSTNLLSSTLACLSLQIQKQHEDSTRRDNATSPGSQAASVGEFSIFYPGLPRSTNTKQQQHIDSTRPNLPWYANKITTLLDHTVQSPDCLTRRFVGNASNFWSTGQPIDSSMALRLGNTTVPSSPMLLHQQHFQLPANYPTPCLSIIQQFGSVTVPSIATFLSSSECLDL
eukprot:Gb_02973 [translate_table: standard]